MKIIRSLIRWLIRLVILVVAIAAVTGIFLVFDYRRFLNTPMVTVDSPKTFTVKSGETITGLSHDFAEYHMPLAKKSPFSGWLGKYYFRYLAKSNDQEDSLKIGEYRLLRGMTPPEVLDLFSSGNTVAHAVRFPEGWTFKKIRKRLKNNENIEQTLGEMSDEDILATLGAQNITNPEGLFFPDTYDYPEDSKDIEVLKQSYNLMQKNLKKAWAARHEGIILKTPYELLILASIIEKETSKKAERRKVSGVFHRRLEKGMRLQTDPTVIYGMGDKYQGKIYKSDLKRDTPYNTYTRKGLPPTPIAMPSLASLMAAGQPDNGDALYFVANGTGGHTFSATYKAHLEAVKVYRKYLADMKKKREEAEKAEAEKAQKEAEEQAKADSKTKKKTKEK